MNERDVDRVLLFAWVAVSIAAFLIERARVATADTGQKLRDAITHADAMESRVLDLSDTVAARDAQLDALGNAAEEATAAELARRRDEQ